VGAKRIIKPSKRLVWSVKEVDLEDPFQRRWFIKKVLEHGRFEDVKALVEEIGLEEIAREIDSLNLPAPIYRLWKNFLERRKIKG